MRFNDLLESTFDQLNPGVEVEQIEKTAEDALFEALRREGAVAEVEDENPYADWSDEDLLKLASETGVLEELQADGGISDDAFVTEGEQEEMGKIAMDVLGGQIMAHAMFHEFSLMKTAMKSGLCRVCKTNSCDPVSSMCNVCGNGGSADQ